MKKVITIVIAVLTIITASVGVCAAESETLTCVGYFNQWTRSYEITDTPLVLEIEHTCDGNYNWEGIVAVFTSKDLTDEDVHPRASGSLYSAVRGDSYINEGDGGTVKNADTTYTSTLADVDNNEGPWNEYREVMKDCDIVATFVKTEDGYTFTYDVTGANGTSFVYTVTSKCDTSAGLYVLFTGENGTFVITESEADEPTETPDEPTVTPDEPTETPDEPTVTPDEPTETPDEPTDAPQTGVAAAILSVAAVLSGAYIVSKKH